jgi:hypothetical protein
MNPIITKHPYTDDKGVYRFTLSGLNVSLSNGLRRTILSEIPTIVFHTETYEDNKCTILKNKICLVDYLMINKKNINGKLSIFIV